MATISRWQEEEEKDRLLSGFSKPGVEPAAGSPELAGRGTRSPVRGSRCPPVPASKTGPGLPSVRLHRLDVMQLHLLRSTVHSAAKTPPSDIIVDRAEK